MFDMGFFELVVIALVGLFVIVVMRKALARAVSSIARRLARLGGSQPDFEAAPRRRVWAVEEDD